MRRGRHRAAAHQTSMAPPTVAGVFHIKSRDRGTSLGTFAAPDTGSRILILLTGDVNLWLTHDSI